MLDAALKTQLQAYLTKVTRPVEIRASLDDGDSSRQMRELLAAAEVSLGARDADDYSGYAETLLIMAQQHNMKEENVLYPMCDQHLAAEADGLVRRLVSAIHEAR